MTSDNPFLAEWRRKIAQTGHQVAEAEYEGAIAEYKRAQAHHLSGSSALGTATQHVLLASDALAAAQDAGRSHGPVPPAPRFPAPPAARRRPPRRRRRFFGSWKFWFLTGFIFAALKACGL